MKTLYKNQEGLVDKDIVSHLDSVWKTLKSGMTPSTFKLLKSAYFAGGCIRSLFTGTHVNDYDIFFPIINGADDFQDKAKKDKNFWNHFTKIKSSSNAYTVRHIKTGYIFQFIKRDSGFFEDVIRRFDFTMNFNAYVPSFRILRIVDRLSMTAHILKVNPAANSPVSALLRSYRFIKEGWTLSALEAMKLIVMATNGYRYESEEDVKKVIGLEKSSSMLTDTDVSEIYKFIKGV